MKKDAKDKLFDYFQENHQVTLLDGDFNEIDHILKSDRNGVVEHIKDKIENSNLPEIEEFEDLVGEFDYLMNEGVVITEKQVERIKFLSNALIRIADGFFLYYKIIGEPEVRLSDALVMEIPTKPTELDWTKKHLEEFIKTRK